MANHVCYWVEYGSLDGEGKPISVRHEQPFPESKWEGVTEQQALQSARRRANELRNYHLNVNIVRVGPRGGRRFVN